MENMGPTSAAKAATRSWWKKGEGQVAGETPSPEETKKELAEEGRAELEGEEEKTELAAA
eukprot:406347-Pyramimonas_sp.AAC.1